MKYKRIDVDGTNCYIIFSEAENKVMLIDPAFEHEKITALCEGRKIDKVALTHGHIDHIYESFSFDAPVFIGENELDYLKNRSLCAPYNIYPELESREYPISGVLSNGDTVKFCEQSFSVIFTPGHTSGHICLYGEGVLFCGDLIFKGSVGRTDFPRGDEFEMAKSLVKVMKLPQNTIVCPGHGPKTTIEEEIKNNEYIDYYTRRFFE